MRYRDNATHSYILYKCLFSVIFSNIFRNIPTLGCWCTFFLCVTNQNAIARTLLHTHSFTPSTAHYTACVSVLDFGAVGDGKTDNFKAFQSALNAAVAGGIGQ